VELYLNYVDWADADHELAAKAIARGLASHSADHRGYWIHTSGTGILSYEDQKLNVIGQPSAKIYCDDDSGIREVTSLPPEAPHRNVDVIVLAASAENNGKVKTAIVCPPTIYGPGRGPGNQRSIQVYDLTSVTLQQGHGVMMGEGQNRWTNVHVHDLSNVYLELVEAAVAGGGKATLDDQGYYFTENGEFIWGEVSRAIAAECKKQGFIDTDEVVTLSIEQLDKVNPVLRAQWARNARGRAVRARKLFGWTPSGRGMYEELGDIVKGEAKNLGLMPGHAKKAAGHA